MPVVAFLRSPVGRVARMVIGFALIVYGSILASLVGLVLMMVGMVPAVSGLVDMCLIGEIGKSSETYRPDQGQHSGSGRLWFRTRSAHRGGSHV